MANAALSPVDELFDALFPARADAPKPTAAERQAAIATRQAQLYSESRFDRRAILDALETVTSDLACGNNPRLMRALQGLVDPVAVGMAVVDGMRESLNARAMQAAEAELAGEREVSR